VIKGLDHVGVVTTDLERATRFYVEKLGFRETMRLETTHSGTIVFVSVDGCEVELFGSGRPPEPSGTAATGNVVGYKHISLLVDSVDAEYARLKTLGVEFTMGPTDAESGLRLAFLRDPDGNPIELLQRPK